MQKQSEVISISMSPFLLKVVEKIAKLRECNRSEVVREALRWYVEELNEDSARFVQVYDATRKEKLHTLAEVKRALKE